MVASSLQLVANVKTAHLLHSCLPGMAFLLFSHSEMLLLKLLRFAEVEAESKLGLSARWVAI